MVRKRILITAIGSLGDIHPSLALASALQRRGHDVGIATAECYVSRVEKAGVRAIGYGPD